VGDCPSAGVFIASFVAALGAIAMALVTDVTGTRLPGNPPLTGVAEPEARH